MTDWSLKLNGEDYTPGTPLDSLEITDTAVNANGRLTARYETIEESTFGVPPGAVVELTHGTATQWRGRLISRAVEPRQTGYSVTLEATDLSAELDRVFVVDYYSGTAIKTDKQVVQELFTTCGTATDLTAPDATVVSTGAELTDVYLNGRTLRQSVEDVISASTTLPDLYTTWSPQNASSYQSSDSVLATGGTFVVAGTANETRSGYTLKTWPVTYTSSGGASWGSADRGMGGVVDGVVASGTFALLGPAGDLLTSTDGTTWTPAGRVPNTSVVVGVGTAGRIATSDTGFFWIERTSPTSNDLYGVAYSTAVSRWVAVGDSGTIVTSDDGMTWATATSGTAVALRAIDYSPNYDKFYAVGDGGTLLTSSSGTAWTAGTAGTTNNLRAVGRWTTTKLIAAGDGGKIITSTNGSTWSAETSNTTNDLYSVASGYAGASIGYVAVAAGGSATIVRSAGSGWTKRTMPFGTQGTFNTITAIEDGYIAATTSGNIDYSDFAGTAWSQLADANQTFRASAHPFVRHVLFSTENKTYRVSSPYTPAPFNVYGLAGGTGTFTPRGIAYGSGAYVVVGTTGTAYRSTDGSAWSGYSVAGTALNAVTYGTSFVAVGAGGSAYVSATGTAWTGYSIGTAAQFWGVAYGTGTYVAVGTAGNIRYSTTGTAWSSATSGTTQNLWNVRYIDNQFVAVGGSATILTSTSGTAWTAQTSGATAVLTDVAYSNGIAVAAGSAGLILRSTDSPDAITYFVDVQGRLNYNISAGTAPYAISDQPDGTASIAADQIAVDYDESGIVNAVYMTSASDDALYSKWVLDSSSIAAYGRREAFVVNENVTDSESADTYGNAYLAERNTPQVRGSFTVTGYDGWKAGQTVTITNSRLGLSGAQFSIIEVATEFLTGTGTRRYRVSFGALPKSLVRLLAAS